MKKVLKSFLFPKFAVIGAVYAVFCVLTFILTGHPVHLALIWNVFLAGLPLVFAEILERGVKKKWVFWAVFAAWVLFLPNAFYVVTDFIHLTDIDFYKVDSYYANARTFRGVQYVFDVNVWLELFNVAAAFFFGTLMGVVALAKMRGVVLKKFGEKFAKVLVPVAAVSSGVAIYIGRFLRFNSWDIWRPWKLVGSLLTHFDGFAALFSLVVAVYIVLVYAIFEVLRRSKNV
jgi:uncharacterized membrane protein